jgi:hypothetical protein
MSCPPPCLGASRCRPKLIEVGELETRLAELEKQAAMVDFRGCRN